MKKIIIGGVPEHFNLPWHLAIENNEFKDKGIDLIWKDFPGGTGDMCDSLRSGDIDIAIILTEGIIKDIINGNPSKIVQTYVDSPLLWGIHVGANSKFQNLADLENTRPAISRYGSGSQLLSIVNAKNNNWNYANLDFQVVGNIQGGIDALTNNTADYFLWEHFTTKPYVDNGIFRRLGNCPSPWPCFVIAISDKLLSEDLKSVKEILEVINKKLQLFNTSDAKNQFIEMFAKEYQLKEEDIIEWLKITEWNKGQSITDKLINNIQKQLTTFNVIDNSIDSNLIIRPL